MRRAVRFQRSKPPGWHPAGVGVSEDKKAPRVARGLLRIALGESDRLLDRIGGQELDGGGKRWWQRVLRRLNGRHSKAGEHPNECGANHTA